jgi:hypothetical protein
MKQPKQQYQAPQITKHELITFETSISTASCTNWEYRWSDETNWWVRVCAD